MVTNFEPQGPKARPHRTLRTRDQEKAAAKTVGVRPGDDPAKLVDRIYGAIRDPRVWNDLVCDIGDWIGADMGMMTSPSLPGHDAVPIVLHRLNLSPIQNTPLMWRAELTLRAIATGRTPGVFLFDELIPPEEQATNEWWQGVVRPLGIGSGLLTVIRAPESGERPVVLSYYRRIASTPFDRNDVAAMETLLPHLRRSLSIALDAPPAEGEARSVYDTIGSPALLFGADARVVYCNKSAHELLEGDKGLSLQDGKLLFAYEDSQVEFDRTLGRVVGDGWTRKVRMGAEMVVRRHDGPPMVLVFTVLGAENPIAQWAAPVRCVLFVLEHTLRLDATLHDRLRRVYGLTGAESDVALALAAGSTLKEIAQTRGSQLQTVRVQLKSTLAKTGTRRQPELVALVNRLQL